MAVGVTHSIPKKMPERALRHFCFHILYSLRKRHANVYDIHERLLFNTPESESTQSVKDVCSINCSVE